MTADWEKQLDSIYTKNKGSAGYADFILGIKGFVGGEITRLKPMTIRSDLQLGQPAHGRKGSSGKSSYKSGYGSKFAGEKKPAGSSSASKGGYQSKSSGTPVLPAHKATKP
jgi:hypothetical protein